MAAIIAMAAIGGWAVATGRVSYIVTHGVSMNPLYHQGDLVFVLRVDRYQPGYIAAYPGPGVEVLHRIVGGNATTGFVFKGDNNKSEDPTVVQPDDIIGRAILHVPKGGVWLKPVLSPTGLGMMGFLIVGGGAAAAPRSRREIPRGRRKKRVKAMSRQGGSLAAAATVLKAVGRLSPVLRVAANVAALMAIFAITLGVLGWMKPTYLLQSRSAGAGQSVTYSYSATVPRSAAYDGTTVTSPDPIFRKLTNRVEVHVRYQGPPGALAMSAQLENGTGWHTTIPVLAEQRFSTRSIERTASLDLNAIEKRAKDATAATGVQGSGVSINLTTEVTGTGFNDFAAPLKLTVAPLQMKLADPSASLVITDKSAESSSTPVPREIAILGVSSMTASSARSWAVLLLIGAAAGSTALYLAARRKAPLRTRAEIEQRYPNLLVHVEQMASPPGKPVVNVDNFPALVKLAERYGQMILTWRRPDADDFVVRDEGITYRYRVPLEEPTLQNIELINRPNSSDSPSRKTSSQLS